MEANNLLHINLAFRTFWFSVAQTIVILQLSIVKETSWNTARAAQLPLACQWGQRLSRACAVALRGAETFIRSHSVWLCSVSLLLVLVFNVALLVFPSPVPEQSNQGAELLCRLCTTLQCLTLCIAMTHRKQLLTAPSHPGAERTPADAPLEVLMLYMFASSLTLFFQTSVIVFVELWIDGCTGVL